MQAARYSELEAELKQARTLLHDEARRADAAGATAAAADRARHAAMHKHQQGKRALTPSTRNRRAYCCTTR